jgi:hypothetical protein
MPLEVEKEMECRLGDMGLDVLVGDTDTEKLGGEPGGVSRGVVLWDAMRKLYGTLGLMSAILEWKKTRKVRIRIQNYNCSFFNNIKWLMCSV